MISSTIFPPKLLSDRISRQSINSKYNGSKRPTVPPFSDALVSLYANPHVTVDIYSGSIRACIRIAHSICNCH